MGLQVDCEAYLPLTEGNHLSVMLGMCKGQRESRSDVSASFEKEKLEAQSNRKHVIILNYLFMFLN